MVEGAVHHDTTMKVEGNYVGNLVSHEHHLFASLADARRRARPLRLLLYLVGTAPNLA